MRRTGFRRCVTGVVGRASACVSVAPFVKRMLAGEGGGVLEELLQEAVDFYCRRRVNSIDRCVCRCVCFFPASCHGERAPRSINRENAIEGG